MKLSGKLIALNLAFKRKNCLLAARGYRLVAGGKVASRI